MDDCEENILNRWEEYELERREKKLDKWLFAVSNATLYFIIATVSDVGYHNFFFYQQESYGLYHTQIVSVVRLFIGIAASKLCYFVPFQTKGSWQFNGKPIKSQIPWVVLFIALVSINFMQPFDDIKDPYILTLYHGTQTISFIVIVVLNRSLFPLILKSKKWVYQGFTQHYANIYGFIFAFLVFIPTLAFSFICPKLPKFFY